MRESVSKMEGDWEEERERDRDSEQKEERECVCVCMPDLCLVQVLSQDVVDLLLLLGLELLDEEEHLPPFGPAQLGALLPLVLTKVRQGVQAAWRLREERLAH